MVWGICSSCRTRTKIILSSRISKTVVQGFFNDCVVKFSVFVVDVDGDWDNSLLAELRTLVNPPPQLSPRRCLREFHFGY